MDGHHVALIFHTLRDEGFRPGDILNDAIVLTGAESCWEHEHVVVALKARLDHCREVATLFARLVDGNAERSQPREVHQQVVDQIAEASIIVSADNGAKGHTVFSAKGMIADKSIKASIIGIGHVFLALNLQRHIQIAHSLLQPFYARFVATLPKESVHFVLVGDALQPTD